MNKPRKVLKHLRRQGRRVFRKFLDRPKEEISNMEEYLLNYSKPLDDETEQEKEARQEWLAERLTRLDDWEMRLIKLRFYNDPPLSLRKIAKMEGYSLWWVQCKLKDIFFKLRQD